MLPISLLGVPGLFLELWQSKCKDYPKLTHLLSYFGPITSRASNSEELVRPIIGRPIIGALWLLWGSS